MAAAIAAHVRQWLASEHVVAPAAWLEACLEFLRDENEVPSWNSWDLAQWRRAVYDQWLHADLCELETPTLPPEAVEQPKFTLRQNVCLQLLSAVDVGQPLYAQLRRAEGTTSANAEVGAEVAADSAPGRAAGSEALALALTDGVREVRALVRRPGCLPAAALRPGAKLLVRGPVPVRRGLLLLPEGGVRPLGGEVDALVERFDAAAALREALETNTARRPGARAKGARGARLAGPPTSFPPPAPTGPRPPSVPPPPSAGPRPPSSVPPPPSAGPRPSSCVPHPPSAGPRPPPLAAPGRAPAVAVCRPSTGGSSSRRQQMIREIFEDDSDDDFFVGRAMPGSARAQEENKAVVGRTMPVQMEMSDRDSAGPTRGLVRLWREGNRRAPGDANVSEDPFRISANVSGKPLGRPEAAKTMPGLARPKEDPREVQDEDFGDDDNLFNAVVEEMDAGGLLGDKGDAVKREAPSASGAEAQDDLPSARRRRRLEEEPFSYILDIYERVKAPEFEGRGRFSVKAFLLTLLGKLEYNDGERWSLLVRLGDGTASVDCQMSDELLAGPLLIGRTARECAELRRLAKGGAGEAVEAARKELVRCLRDLQARLATLNGLFEIELDVDCGQPMIVGYRDVDADAVAALRDRIRRADVDV